MDVQVAWQGDQRFVATTGSGISVPLDGDAVVGASPMEALAAALGACMGIDVVDILEKGRQPVTGLAVRLDGDRRDEPPRRFTRIRLAFDVAGEGLSRSKVERAVALSRDRYCSVWASMAPDIALDVEIEIH